MNALTFQTIFFALVLTLLGCTPRFSSVFVSTDDMPEYEPSEQLKYNTRQKINSLCLEPGGYIPDTNYLDQFERRLVNICFHFMNSADSTQNFNGQEAEEYAYNLFSAVNGGMKNNVKLNLPPGNDIPVLPTQIRFEWAPDQDGKVVYCHYDDDLYYAVTRGKDRNNADRRVLEKYGRKDGSINIFMMPHHPDSVASETYANYNSGIALGTDVKVFGAYENKMKPWQLRGLLVHELGHVLGLSHAWTGYDGCTDTQKHNNCFNYTNTPPCDTEVSNNVMDYNIFQNAFSPCQIGKIHENLSRFSSSQRKLLLKNWCTLNEDKTIFIEDDVVWNGSKDLQGHLVIIEGASLTIRCRVAFPAGAKLIVEPGANLYLENAWLHNDCGEQWQGIEIQQLGKDQFGRVFKYGEVRVEDTISSNLASQGT